MFLAALLLAACGDDESSTTSATAPTSLPTTANPPTTSDPSGTSGTDPTGPTSTTAPAEGAPMFLSFNTNVPKLTEGESVVFTALLTDPDGVDDIIGGSLVSADESIDFGPFVAAGQPGTYSITLSWAQIHQADPIAFENGEPTRTFVARFFDQKSNKAVQSVEVGLFCAGGSACGGVCTDLAVDGGNCGACGRACDGGVDACGSGACLPAYGACVSYGDGPATCAEICQLAGETCVAQGCDNKSTALFFDDLNDCEGYVTAANGHLACDEVHQWDVNSMSIRCCCTDTK